MHDLLSIPRSQILTECFKRGLYEPFCTYEGAVHLKQIQALSYLTDSNTRELFYGGAAGGAKSWTGCTWLVNMCMQYSDTRWFIGREELKRLRESTLMTFFKVCKAYGFKDWKYNAQDHYIQFNNGSRIDLLDLKYLPSDPMYERYGSTEYTGGWIEEAGEVHFKAYETLKSRIGRQNNDKYGIKAKIFCTLNPKKNWVHQVAWKPFKNKTLPPDRIFLQAFVQDNPFIPQSYIDNLKSITDKVQKERLLYGNFDYEDDAAALCTYDKISDIFTNTHVSYGDRKITVDAARFGGDKIVCILWHGLRGRIVWWSKSSLDDSLKQIEKLRIEHKCGKSDVLVDEGGVGGGLVDFGKYKGFINNARPIASPTMSPQDDYQPENFDMLKSQCAFRLSDKINNNEIYLECEDVDMRETIIEEIEQSLKQKEIDSDKKKGIVPKDKVKELLGRSPDFFDAINQRMWFELTTRESFVDSW